MLIKTPETHMFTLDKVRDYQLKCQIEIGMQTVAEQMKQLLVRNPTLAYIPQLTQPFSCDTPISPVTLVAGTIKAIQENDKNVMLAHTPGSTGDAVSFFHLKRLPVTQLIVNNYGNTYTPRHPQYPYHTVPLRRVAVEPHLMIPTKRGRKKGQAFPGIELFVNTKNASVTPSVTSEELACDAKKGTLYVTAAVLLPNESNTYNTIGIDRRIQDLLEFSPVETVKLITQLEKLGELARVDRENFLRSRL